MAPRRLGAMFALVALVVGGCSPGEDERATPPPSATTTSAVEGAACKGLGPVLAGGEVTWTVGSQLRSPQGCLLDLAPAGGSIAWNGAGDHLLVGGQRILTAAGKVLFASPRPTWRLQVAR